MINHTDFYLLGSPVIGFVSKPFLHEKVLQRTVGKKRFHNDLDYLEGLGLEPQIVLYGTMLNKKVLCNTKEML